jgi:hypothetical protein
MELVIIFEDWVKIDIIIFIILFMQIYNNLIFLMSFFMHSSNVKTFWDISFFQI